MPLYPVIPQKPPQDGGIIARLKGFMTPKSPIDAASMMVNPVGAVALPGMLSEGRLVPMLLKILREKGLDPTKAETVLLDAATSGRIDPNQFKLVFDALGKIKGGGTAPAAQRFAAGTRAMPEVQKVASSIAAGGVDVAAPQVGVPPVSEMVKQLRTKFQGGQR